MPQCRTTRAPGTPIGAAPSTLVIVPPAGSPILSGFLVAAPNRDDFASWSVRVLREQMFAGQRGSLVCFFSREIFFLMMLVCFFVAPA